MKTETGFTFWVHTTLLHIELLYRAAASESVVHGSKGIEPDSAVCRFVQSIRAAMLGVEQMALAAMYYAVISSIAEIQKAGLLEEACMWLTVLRDSCESIDEITRQELEAVIARLNKALARSQNPAP